MLPFDSAAAHALNLVLAGKALLIETAIQGQLLQL